MKYSINEAFKELADSKEFYLKEDNVTLSWVERIQNLINEKKLDPQTLEEFIKDHEEIDVDDIEGPNLYSPRFNYKDQIRYEFAEVGDGYFRTDMFDNYPAPAQVLIRHLNDDKRKLGYDYFIVDGDGRIILIDDSFEVRGLRNWLNACEFEDKEDAMRFLNMHDTNISEEDIEDYFD